MTNLWGIHDRRPRDIPAAHTSQGGGAAGEAADARTGPAGAVPAGGKHATQSSFGCGNSLARREAMTGRPIFLEDTAGIQLFSRFVHERGDPPRVWTYHFISVHYGRWEWPSRCETLIHLPTSLRAGSESGQKD
jgi:hypothetical protein